MILQKLIILLATLLCQSAFADNNFDYKLSAQEIAKDTYIFEGKKEDFSKKNGGLIVNTGFIVTEEGVIVIDSGPSKMYAEQQRAAIAAITDKPIIRVYITHHHPDHFLGNQVYADSQILALPATIEGMHTEGEMFLTNMYRLIGDWAKETSIKEATKKVKAGTETVGGHKLQTVAFDGHTQGDLVIFDHTTGVLFAGDLVFNQRAATTPHANINRWLKTLSELSKLPFKTLVPGHGSISTDQAAISETTGYLKWLETTLKNGAETGLTMIEVMNSEIPERFKTISLAKEELSRSAVHLFPAMEEAVLNPANSGN